MIVSSLRRHLPVVRTSVIAAAVVAVALLAGAAPAQADITGACCKPNGSCIETWQSSCDLNGGVYEGDMTLCSETVCPTTTTNTTSTTSTTSSTLEVKGACCLGSGCAEYTQDYCQQELNGHYKGDGTSCDDPGVCVNCGDGCVQYGEQCDDGDTENLDGCDEKCSEETCWKCTEAQASNDRTIVPFCLGPSQCFSDDKCGYCGDGQVGPGEDCDPGQEAPNDCCLDCQYEASGTSCSDGLFCDGAETCDGRGTCVQPQTGPDCSHLDGECVVGVCDNEAAACIEDTTELNDTPCEGAGACTVGGSGTCQDGECVGAGTVLSPSCRWIIVAGSPDGDVRVRSGEASSVDANACGDTARSAGLTSASIVVTADAADGEGVFFYGPPEVGGDIVTGGASVGASLYITIPGTDVKNVATGMTVAKLPAGQVDTTGAHALVEVCDDDQALVAAALPVLDAMGDPDREEGGDNGLKVAIGGNHPIDVTGQGIAVVDMDGLKLGHGATLNLIGNATDVVMLRINGRTKLGYGSAITLTGLVPTNVLIYGQGERCRLSPGVVGAGTVLCPEANKFVVGVGTEWTGTFLGGQREVQVRYGAQLTHAAFTGF